MSLIIDVVAQVAHAQDVREGPQTVPLIPSKPALEARPVVVRKHTSPLELIFSKISNIHVVFPTDITALALARALEGLARVRTTIRPLERTGAVHLIPIPLARVRRAVLAR